MYALSLALIFLHSGLTHRPSRHTIKSLGLGRRMIYLVSWTFNVFATWSVALFAVATHILFATSPRRFVKLLRFGDGSCHETSFARPCPCSRVFVHLVLLRSVRSCCRFVRLS